MTGIINRTLKHSKVQKHIRLCVCVFIYIYMGPTALLPSEGRRAEGFFALKMRRLRPGLNPRTSVLKASTLPLDHYMKIFSYPLLPDFRTSIALSFPGFARLSF